MAKQILASDVKLPGYTEQQVQRAVASLLKFVGDQKSKGNDLFDDEETLNINIALKKMPLQSRKDKPIPLELPHPLLALEGAEVCLFVKDHKGEGHKEGKEKVKAFEGNGGVTKVIGISKLRTKYESHEAKRWERGAAHACMEAQPSSMLGGCCWKPCCLGNVHVLFSMQSDTSSSRGILIPLLPPCRQLCKLYDIFLADERILPSLPKLIGKSFFKVGSTHPRCFLPLSSSRLLVARGASTYRASS
jgi:hypothetical protein